MRNVGAGSAGDAIVDRATTAKIISDLETSPIKLFIWLWS